MDVSIVIPTKNGGHLFEKVLDAVFKQKTEYEYEVICVDSGSKDGTLDVIRKYPCRLFQIEPSEFGHGKTRNYVTPAVTARRVPPLRMRPSPHCKVAGSHATQIDNHEI